MLNSNHWTLLYAFSFRACSHVVDLFTVGLIPNPHASLPPVHELTYCRTGLYAESHGIIANVRDQLQRLLHIGPFIFLNNSFLRISMTLSIVPPSSVTARENLAGGLANR